jgi:hypothetical protein
MKLKWLISIGVVTAFIAALAMIPATSLERMINQRLGDSGALRVSSGTIWVGSGTLFLGAPNTRLPQLEIPLRWSFAPTGLLRGRLAFDVIADGKPLKGILRVGAGFSNVDIRDADLMTSLEVMGRFHRNLALLRASGDIALRSESAGESLTINYAAPHLANGKLRLAAREVRLRTISNDAFGSYDAALIFAGQDIRYVIDKSTGMLALKGDGLIALGGTRQFRYKGVATVARSAPPWLSAALLAVGRPSLDGRFNIDYQTRF